MLGHYKWDKIYVWGLIFRNVQLLKHTGTGNSQSVCDLLFGEMYILGVGGGGKMDGSLVMRGVVSQLWESSWLHLDVIDDDETCWNFSWFFPKWETAENCLAAAMTNKMWMQCWWHCSHNSSMNSGVICHCGMSKKFRAFDWRVSQICQYNNISVKLICRWVGFIGINDCCCCWDYWASSMDVDKERRRRGKL